MVEKTKFATVAIFGMPNVGKSTFFNYIMKKQLSIVTHKPQTTQSNITGIITQQEKQIVFLDTPGIFKTGGYKSDIMMKNISAALYQADFILVFINLNQKDIDKELKKLSLLVDNKEGRIIFVITKIDITDEKDVIHAKQKIKLLGHNSIFCISALKGTGIKQLLKYIKKNTSEGKWLYNKDDKTTNEQKFIYAEITRKNLLLFLEQEIPYKIIVITEKIETLDDEKKIVVYQQIFTKSPSHKKIIEGKNKQRLQKILNSAQSEIKVYTGLNKCELKIGIKISKILNSDSLELKYDT